MRATAAAPAAERRSLLAVWIVLVLALGTCRGALGARARAGLAATALTGPSRRLQQDYTEKPPRCNEIVIGCSSCTRDADKQVVACKACRGGYKLNKDTNDCDCAPNFGTFCSMKKDTCFCRRCRRPKKMEPGQALGGGPIGSAECVTDDAGRPDAVGATLDIDRECDDSTGEVVANTLTDIVAGVDGVVGDSAGYMVKCTERKVKGVTRRGNSTSAFTTYAKYSFRVEFQSDDSFTGSVLRRADIANAINNGYICEEDLLDMYDRDCNIRAGGAPKLPKGVSPSPAPLPGR